MMVSLAATNSGLGMTDRNTDSRIRTSSSLLILAVLRCTRYYLVYLYMKHKGEQPVPAGTFEACR
jgi:hypothetical protein